VIDISAQRLRETIETGRREPRRPRASP